MPAGLRKGYFVSDNTTGFQRIFCIGKETAIVTILRCAFTGQ